MLRSMSSAVTGLKAMQTEMDVIANNVANVETDGYKSSSASFSDMFYQTLNAGTATTNPSQVGYGTQVTSVDKNMGRVGATETDSALDLYIDGDGYFVVNTEKDGSGSTEYTRVGNFSINSDGYLVNSNGDYVMGTVQNSDGTISQGSPINLKSKNSLVTLNTEDGDIIPVDSDDYGDITDITLNQDGTITATYGDYVGTLKTATASADGGATELDYSKLSDIAYDSAAGTYSGTYNGTADTAITVGTSQNIVIGLANFANEEGLAENGNTMFIATKSSGSASYMQAGNGNSDVLRSGFLEMSNVDLATEFTKMISTERAYQANSRVITVSDTLLEELVNMKRS